MSKDDPILIGASEVTTRSKNAKRRMSTPAMRTAEQFLFKFRFDPMVDDEKDVESVPCAFTGEPVVLRKVSNGFWMGVGPFYTTKLFNFKRELIWHLAQRPWHMPDYTPRPEVTVKERLPTPLEILGPEGDKREKDKRVQEAVDELVERSAKKIGLKK